MQGEILYREALAMGLHKDDEIVKRPDRRGACQLHFFQLQNRVSLVFVCVHVIRNKNKDFRCEYRLALGSLPEKDRALLLRNRL